MFYDMDSSSMDYSNRMTVLHGICSPAKYRKDFRQEDGGILTETSVPTGAIRRCEIQGRNDIREEWLNLTKK